MGSTVEIGKSQPILLFDGECKFCNGTVNFILRNEADHSLKFVPLQSNWVKSNLNLDQDFAGSLDTIVLIKDDVVMKRSEAVFELLTHLKAPWRYLVVLKIVPTFISNFFYNLIARYRYLLFGKQPSCTIPTSEVSKRFLDSI